MIARWVTSSWILLCLATFSACMHAQEQSQSAVSALSGPTWQLVEFRSDGQTLVPADRSHYTAVFNADGSTAVRVDCNRGRGTWHSAQHQQLVLSPLALTRMACPPSPLTDRFAKDWESLRTYTLKAGYLFLSLADGGTYEFERQASGTTLPLENTDWKLTRLSGAAVTLAPKQQAPHIVLNSELRRVVGSGGCNQITGGYELNGDHLAFSKMAVTMMACINGMETETAFFDALNHAAKWRITGQELELYDASGKSVASLEARHMK